MLVIIFMCNKNSISDAGLYFIIHVFSIFTSEICSTIRQKKLIIRFINFSFLTYLWIKCLNLKVWIGIQFMPTYFSKNAFILNNKTLWCFKINALVLKKYRMSKQCLLFEKYPCFKELNLISTMPYLWKKYRCFRINTIVLKIPYVCKGAFRNLF